jgi:hypothetical protein
MISENPIFDEVIRQHEILEESNALISKPASFNERIGRKTKAKTRKRITNYNFDPYKIS